MQTKRLRIIQDEDAFRFSMDAVLLSHFATVFSADTVVDLGTGTGIIPLLLTSRASLALLRGIEIQPRVAERAQRSVQLNGLQNLIEIIVGDLRRVQELLPGFRANLVVANPPYLRHRQGQASPRPQQAIARHEICCRLADVVKAAAYLLGSGGRFALVHRPERLTEIFHCLQKNRLEPKRLRLVHPRAAAPANMVLIESRRDGRPGLTVLPPLYVYAGDDYSDELKLIYRGEGGL